MLLPQVRLLTRAMFRDLPAAAFVGRVLLPEGIRASFWPTSMRTLPDYLRKNMKMILVGSNPGDRSARVGHYYAGRGNQFWPLMYESGVIPEPIGYEDDRRVVEL